jgi:hypothetical protein
MKKIFLSAFILSAAFIGCKVDDEFAGPDLVDLYGSFSVLQELDISNRSVDFSAGESTFFTATFSKNIEWNVRVKGLSSGAIKNITGFSNELKAENALWTGTTTVLPMFRGEQCAVEVTFLNEPDTLRDTLTVEAGRVNQGFLLTDFEDGFPSTWNTFVQTGANMTFVVQTNNNAAQGNKYYDMGGNVNWDWLKGLVNIPASAYGSPRFDLNSNPENVFFNAFLFKPETINNGLVLFQFREDDNEDGTYNAANEDMFSLEINPQVNGWQHVFRNYADLATLVNGAPAADIGNGLREPHKLFQVSILFLANPTSGYSQSYLDYMIFTEGAPLNP